VLLVFFGSAIICTSGFVDDAMFSHYGRWTLWQRDATAAVLLQYICVQPNTAVAWYRLSPVDGECQDLTSPVQKGTRAEYVIHHSLFEK